MKFEHFNCPTLNLEVLQQFTMPSPLVYFIPHLFYIKVLSLKFSWFYAEIKIALHLKFHRFINNSSSHINYL